MPSPATRERILLALTVIGFVVPNVMLTIFIARNGLDLDRYFGDWYGTLPAAQINVDLAIVAVVFFLFAWWEARRIGVERWWLVFPASCLVGLCFGAPLFLWQRERALNR